MSVKTVLAVLEAIGAAATCVSAHAAEYVAGADPRIESLEDGKIAFAYDEDGKITELRMTPGPGEALTLSGDTLNFAAGARILPGGQDSDEGSQSVITCGFTAAGALEFDGVTNMTWTGSDYLSTTPVTVFTNTRIDDVVPLYGYGKVGTGAAAVDDTHKYTVYFVEREGDVMRVELQRNSDPHRRGVYIELAQDGSDITGKLLKSCYKEI